MRRTATQTRIVQAGVILARTGRKPKLRELAAEMGVSKATAGRVLAEAAPAVAELAQRSIAAQCDDLVRKAIPAIAAGLDDSTDSYKRAGVGISVLKGRGVFSPDSQGASYQTIVMATPDGLRDTLLSDGPAPQASEGTGGIARFPAESEVAE